MSRGRPPEAKTLFSRTINEQAVAGFGKPTPEDSGVTKFVRDLKTSHPPAAAIRHVLVLKGTWYTGTGENFDMDKTVPLKPGSYMKHPAKAVHFDGAKDEEVIVQITGIGPGTTTFVKP